MAVWGVNRHGRQGLTARHCGAPDWICGTLARLIALMDPQIASCSALALRILRNTPFIEPNQFPADRLADSSQNGLFYVAGSAELGLAQAAVKRRESRRTRLGRIAIVRRRFSMLRSIRTAEYRS